jgi:predicted nucleotide-binding protein
VYKYERVNTFVGLEDAVNRRPGRNSLDYKVDDFKQRLDNKIQFLKTVVRIIPALDVANEVKPYITKSRTFYNTGFIVHGHNEARKFEVARFVENDLNKKAIILHEMPNKGRTIIEKFEDYSTVDFAVSLWTADDIGKSKKEQELSDRARQNVVFETAFFIGKLGRENVIVLLEEGVEKPSDYNGVIYIPLSGNWKDELRKEVNEIYRV